MSIIDIILAELEEQQHWATDIAPWHPRAEHNDDTSGDDGDDDGEDDSDDDDDVGGEDEDEDGFVRVPRAQIDEHNRLRREAAEASKRSRAAEREARKSRERERREQGQYDEILAEKDEEVAGAAARAEAAEYQLGEFQRRIRISAAANRIGFKDAEDAVRFLDEDDTEDDVSTERALKRLAREKPYLIDTRRSSGAPINGERQGSLSYDDVKKMSQDEINARWDEVQQALSAGTS